MSTEKRVTFNEHGEPTVVITIKGWDDAFRFAWAMAHLQCDFSDVGRRIAGSLRRKLGAARFAEWQQRFTGKRTLSWVRDDPEATAPLPQPVGVGAGEQSGEQVRGEGNS